MSGEEIKNYVGTSLPNGVTQIDGPMSPGDAGKKIAEVESEGLQTSNVKANNAGEAILKVMSSVINREKVNK